jgi:hypothetical protein
MAFILAGGSHCYQAEVNLSTKKEQLSACPSCHFMGTYRHVPSDVCKPLSARSFRYFTGSYRDITGDIFKRPIGLYKNVLDICVVYSPLNNKLFTYLLQNKTKI